jgi:hypothetical protein
MSERFTRKLLHPDKVSDLLAQHSASVNNVLEKSRAILRTKPELEEAARRAPLDDLFALRFFLSVRSGDVEEAVKHLIETLEWRSKRLEILEDAANGKFKRPEEASKYSIVGYVGLLDGLHPVLVVRAGRCNTKGLASMMTFNEMVDMQLLQSEQIFRECDRKTRETGLLCKQIGIIDLEGFSLFRFDSKYSKVIGRASALSAVYYPQLLGKTVIINMPMAFRLLFRGMSVFMPASTLEKQAICPGNTLKQSASECPFLKKFGNGVELMPPFLGGTGPIPPSLVLQKEQ